MNLFSNTLFVVRSFLRSYVRSFVRSFARYPFVGCTNEIFSLRLFVSAKSNPQRRVGAAKKKPNGTGEQNELDEGGEKLSRQKIFDVLCVLFLSVFFCSLSLQASSTFSTPSTTTSHTHSTE